MDSIFIPQRRLVIDTAQLAPYEAWALLMTYLAFPEPDISERAFEEAFTALCHVHLSMRRCRDEQWAIQPQPIKPLYVFLDPKTMNRALRTFDRRLRDRMIAARIAIAFLKEVIDKDGFKLPKSVKRLSLNELSAFVASDLQGVEANNVEQRVWRPSVPVLHLAVALALRVDALEREGMSREAINDDTEGVPLVMACAQQIQPLLLASTRLRLRADQLIALEYR